MAIKRIRYVKTKEVGVLESARNIRNSTGSMYYVILNTNDCTFTIVNVVSKRKYHGGEGINNITVLKRHVKKRLQEFGVDFALEVRKERNK